MVAHGLLDEVDVVLAQRPEVPQRLRDRPAPVRVEPQPGTRAERLADGRDHLEVLRVVEADLEVEDLEARREAVGDLSLEALPRAAREVVEVRGLLLLEPAEEPPERLSARSAADVPQRHVDPGPGEVARAGAELPEAVREDVAAHRLAVPRIASDDERRHRARPRPRPRPCRRRSTPRPSRRDRHPSSASRARR